MKKFALFLLLGSLVLTASAWNDQGHMMVASIAYNQLNSKDQEKLVTLLKQHPDYEREWKSDYRKFAKDVPLGMYLLMRASIWPDEIRDREDPSHIYHRGPWHYITYKIKFGSTHETDMPEEENIVWAINKASSDIKGNEVTDDQKAVMMCWMAHLVGDIHQPLHNGSIFDSVYPEGDRGGNSFYIKPADKGINLHYLWDSLLGSSLEPRDAKNAANVLFAQHSKKSFGSRIKEQDARDWSCESFELAISTAHLNGRLKGGTDEASAQPLPENYLKNARALADTQIVLAGYRLAAKIKRAL